MWLSSRDNQGIEINWQEFATVLLESGEVDRIIVTNAKVKRSGTKAQEKKFYEVPQPKTTKDA